MRIALLTDAWQPQINGVVTTLNQMVTRLRGRGHEVEVVHPYRFLTFPCPTYYPDVRLALLPHRKLSRILDAFQPEAIHLTNEGPVGLAGRKYCVKRGLPFTTTFTTKYPEYIHLRTGISLDWLYGKFRWFHGGAARTTVATQDLKDELEKWGFENLVFFERGVDTGRWRPVDKSFLDLPRPINLYMGRVAVEKNLVPFLEADVPGSKAVVGDGPQLKRLRKRFPDVAFFGAKTGEDLVRHVGAADVFVFPSKTDTFGLVMLESMATGLPVAAHPVTGPRDVLVHGETGWLDEDIAVAIRKCQELAPTCADACRARAEAFPWERCVDQLESHLEPVGNAPAPSSSVTAAAI